MYVKDDIYRAFKGVIKGKHDIVFISGNLASLGPHGFSTKDELLGCMIEILFELCGPKTTLMTSTFTLNLANTDIPFDPDRTESMHGAIANHFLKIPGRVRSFHPFTSFTCIGDKAEYVCKNNSRHSYGLDSPYDRMLSFENPLTISVGMPPNLTCSLIHHIEFVMHVPYRYVKEFYHPVVKGGKIQRENFYMHVIYHEIYNSIKRNRNVRFFKAFEEKYPIYVSYLGRGKVFSYETKKFFQVAVDVMRKDIYAWLDEPPEQRPYRR